MAGPRRESPAGDELDPLRAFAARLRQLQIDSGEPSLNELVRLMGKQGIPIHRSTIDDKLHGRTAPDRKFVEAFVRACAVHIGGQPDLAAWRDWHAQLRRDLAASRTPRRRPEEDSCPYRGLLSFTVEHAAWFHGRTAAADEVLAKLASHPPGVLLLGPSGAGKSSLVQAGVLPKLTTGALPGSDQWITVVVRAGIDLHIDLNNAGLPGADDDLTTAVHTYLATQPAGTRVVLVIDQFEELLTSPGPDGHAAAQHRVLDQLATAAGSPRLSMIMIMRDDFYPRLASQAPDLLKALTPGLLNIPGTLSTQDLREIITLPAESVGLRCQDELAERIVTDVLTIDSETAATRRASVTVLPLLELTLEQLWQRRSGGQLTHEAYQRVGGVAGALTTWCDAATAQLTATEQSTAERILTALVRPADDLHHIPAVRQQVLITALQGLADPINRAPGNRKANHQVKQVLDALINHRIVTTRVVRLSDSNSGAPRAVAELVHDALIRDWPKLRDWVRRNHRFQDWLRRAGEQHRRWLTTHDAGDLLHGSDLAEGREWLEKRSIRPDIVHFLAESRRAEQVRARRARRTRAVLAALLVAALTAASLAGWQWRTAVAAQRTAVSRQLAAESASLIDTNPDLASLLAVQAYRTSPTTQAASSLYAAAALPLLRRLTGYRNVVTSVAFSRDGRTLATASGDTTVRLWDVASGQTRAVLTGHTDPVTSVAFNPDGRTLASASGDGTVRLWDLASRQTRATLTGPSKTTLAGRRLIAPVLSVAFSPDGGTLAYASSDGTIRLSDLASGHAGKTLTADKAPVTSVVFSPDGRTLASASDDGTARVWDVLSSQTRATVTSHVGVMSSVAFSPDGRTLASASGDGTVQLSDPINGQTEFTLSGHRDSVGSLAFSPDGRTLASASGDSTVRLWDVASHQSRLTLIGHTDRVMSVAFSPDGRTLASASGDGTVRLSDPASDQPRAIIAGHTKRVTVMAFSPDGHTLASASNSEDGTVRLWDVSTGRPLAALTGDTFPVVLAAFSQDGRTLAVAYGDGGLASWDVATVKRLTMLTNEGEPLLPVAFSADSRTLAVAGRDGTVQLRDVRDGQTRTTLRGRSICT